MSTELELHNIGSELEKDLDASMVESLSKVSTPSPVNTSQDILDLNALARVYKDELEGLKAARADMVMKRDWYNGAISTIDKRIEVNLGALKTLETPKVKTEGQETS